MRLWLDFHASQTASYQTAPQQVRVRPRIQAEVVSVRLTNTPLVQSKGISHQFQFFFGDESGQVFFSTLSYKYR